MNLRDHPLMRCHGAHNWPPFWTETTEKDGRFIMGEVGILAYVYSGELQSSKCFLVIEHEQAYYVGSLLFDDAPFCHQIINLLRQHIGDSIENIGDLEIADTLSSAKNQSIEIRPLHYLKSTMTLRESPQMDYRGQPNWPPVWVCTSKQPGKKLTGEVGVLTDAIWYPTIPARLFLRMNLDQERYMGTLLFTDRDFCFQLYGILQQHVGRPIKKIGDLDLSFTL